MKILPAGSKLIKLSDGSMSIPSGENQKVTERRMTKSKEKNFPTFVDRMTVRTRLWITITNPVIRFCRVDSEKGRRFQSVLGLEN